MRNARIRESTVIGDALRRIAALLPDLWLVEDRIRILPNDAQADAAVDLVAPTGERISFVVEAKRSGTVPSAYLLATLRELRRSRSLPVLFLSDYIGPSTAEALTAEGVSYADATGWVRVVSEAPWGFSRGRAQQNRRVPECPRRSLDSTASPQVASSAPCALRTRPSEFVISPLSPAFRPGQCPSPCPPWHASVHHRTATSAGGVVAVRRRALIQRWTRDDSFAKTNRSVGYFIAPRGLDRTLLAAR